jgi:hypothetical protein
VTSGDFFAYPQAAAPLGCTQNDTDTFAVYSVTADDLRTANLRAMLQSTDCGRACELPSHSRRRTRAGARHTRPERPIGLPARGVTATVPDQAPPLRWGLVASPAGQPFTTPVIRQREKVRDSPL